MFAVATHSQQSYILTILHRMLVSHAKVTSADGKAALDYVSRFIRRVLSVLGTEGQATDQIPELPVTQAIADASLGADIQFFESLGLVSACCGAQLTSQSELIGMWNQVGDDFGAQR